MKIAVDFDGTIVKHEFPDIGAENPDAFRWLKEFQAAGAKLILFTMRSDSDKVGPVLTDAVEHCRKSGIEFYGVNRDPDQDSWTSSPKAYANIYIDDAAFGCPLAGEWTDGGRPYVDWSVVGPAVMKELAGCEQEVA